MTASARRIENGAAGSGRAPPARHAAVALVCVVLAMFLSALSQTVVATTMPLIIADLGGFDRYAWAALSYLITATLAYPIIGRLSDIFGRRVFLLMGMAVFAAGSILVGLSESMTQLIVFRGVQGLGGGAVMTCCYASVADLFQPEDRGRFHGLLSAVYALSFVAGPLLGGWLADALSWSWGFLLIGFMGFVLLFPIARAFPKPGAAPTEGDLDLKGIIALVLAVPPLFIALSFGGVQYDWGSPLVIGLLLFSMAMGGVFIAIEARAGSPIMPLSLYAAPVVSLGAGIMLLLGCGLYGSVLFLPLLFQVVYGFTATQSGGLLIPLLLGMALGGAVAGQMLSARSARYRTQALVCAGLMTAGLYLLSTLEGTTGVVHSQVYIVIAGLGVGGLIATVSVGVQNHVPFRVVGAATSALQFHRSLGGVVALAVLGAVLATRFSSSLAEVVPEAVKAALADGRFEDLKKDPRALVDPAASNRLTAELMVAGPEGAAAARELLDSLRVALQAALDSVFRAASLAAALCLGLALFFRVTVRSCATAGETDGIEAP